MSTLSIAGACPVCGIDEREWGTRDTANTLWLAPVLRRLWSEGLPEAPWLEPVVRVGAARWTGRRR